MLKIIQSPSKYIQGANALSQTANYGKLLADNYFVIADDFVMAMVKNTVKASFNEQKMTVHFATFHGECCHNEIRRLADEMKAHHCNGIIGIGGGKTLDTAKALGYFEKVPVIIAPTIASTDAPTSALSVIYTEDGQFEEYLMYPSNPNIIIMDSSIIAKAPVRLLIAGMGDALSTYFEARACCTSRATSMAGGQSTLAALAIAELCYKTLIREGYKAKLAAEKGVVTPALEAIIEANTYLSGLGFESCGLAAAHAIHNGFTVLSECHHLYHGEKVAFGTLCQLVLENSELEEIQRVLSFCHQLGLPITLDNMGVKENIEEKIMAVAKASCAEGETIHNMPCKITVDAVYAAIITADTLGRDFIANK